MRLPLFVPVLASLLLGATLVVLLWDLASPPPQWPPVPAMEVVEPVLPVSSQGSPIKPVDVVVSLQHSPIGSSCRRVECTSLEHWYALVLSRASAEGDQPYPVALSADESLRDWLDIAAEAAVGRPRVMTESGSDPQCSLLLRAPATTPARVVVHLLRDCLYTHIRHVGFSIANESEGTEEKNLDASFSEYAFPWPGSWYPSPAGEYERLSVILECDSASDACRARILEWVQPVDKFGWLGPAVAESETEVKWRIEKQLYPCDASGLAAFASFASAWTADAARRNAVSIGQIEMSDDVPFQVVVDFVSALRTANIGLLEFVCW